MENDKCRRRAEWLIAWMVMVETESMSEVRHSYRTNCLLDSVRKTRKLDPGQGKSEAQPMTAFRSIFFRIFVGVVNLSV
jgi:hypothetical protein